MIVQPVPSLEKPRATRQFQVPGKLEGHFAANGRPSSQFSDARAQHPGICKFPANHRDGCENSIVLNLIECADQESDTEIRTADIVKPPNGATHEPIGRVCAPLPVPSEDWRDYPAPPLTLSPFQDWDILDEVDVVPLEEFEKS